MSEELKAAIEAANQEVVKAAPLIVTSIVEELTSKNYLSKSTLDVLTRKSERLTITEDGKSYKAIFISYMMTSSNRERALRKIAHSANVLSNSGLIHSVLAPMSTLQLARMPGMPDRSVVFFFPMVPEDRMDEVNKLVEHVPEGEIGKDIDDSFHMPEGDFYAEINISSALPAVTGKTKEELLEDEIQAYLSVLPKGTTVVSKTECAIVTLAIPFEVVFRNPIMKDFKKVELDYVRQAAVVNDKIEQFNLLVGVKYTRRNGTTISFKTGCNKCN